MSTQRGSVGSDVKGFFSAIRSSVEWLYANIIWAVCGILFLNTAVFAAGQGVMIILAILNGFLLILLFIRLWKSRKARGY